MKEDFIKKFQRTTSSGRYIAEIDGFRFLAISLVILFHLSGWDKNLYGETPNQLWKFLDMGNIGVQFFFVISGFIIALPFISSYTLQKKRSVDIKKYFFRRLVRLEPPYIIVMSAYYFIAIFISSHDFDTLLPHYLSSIFYSHGFIYNSRSIINSVAWSLEIEIQFYLLAPLIFQVFNLSRTIRRSILLFTIIFWPFLFNIIGMQHLNIIGSFHFFLAGALLCDVYTHKRKPNKNNVLNDFISCLFFLAIFFFLNEKNSLVQYFLAPMIFIIYLSIFQSVYLLTFFRNKYISTIGGMCYSIYLIHLPLAGKMKEFLINNYSFNSFTIDYFIGLFIITPIIIIASAVYFLYIEKPFMQTTFQFNRLNSLKKLVTKPKKS